MSAFHPLRTLGSLRINTRMSGTNSYGPDPMLVAFWALICSPPTFVFAYLLFKAPSYGSLIQFAWMLVFPLLPVLFASRFRATFAPTEFVYRRWGPTIRVPYADIERIEVTNVTPFTKEEDRPLPKKAVGAFLVTKHGERLPFWPKLFPHDAVNRFFALAR